MVYIFPPTVVLFAAAYFFRRYMASEPDKWDYVVAGIPSALTDDLEAAQAAKKVCLRFHYCFIFF
jgi:hypothetical protein